MVHLKRHKTPKNWPITRKGTTFVVKPISGEIPLLIILRDMLKVAQNRKEVKQAIHMKNILLNNSPVKDDKQGAFLFDTISLVPAKKYYRVILSKYGRFDVQEISEAESKKKNAKIANKTKLKGNKIQLNLIDGKNYIVDLKCKTNDSAVVNFEKRTIESCLPLKEKATVLVTAGKHAGKGGVVKSINEERKMTSLDYEGQEINVLIKQLVVVK